MHIPSIKNILRATSLIFILEAVYYCPALAQPGTTSEATNSTWAEDDVPEIALSLDDAPMPSTALFIGFPPTTHLRYIAEVLKQEKAFIDPPKPAP